SKELLDTRSFGYELTEKEQKAAAEAREKQLREVKAEVAERFTSGKAEIEKKSSEAHAAIAVEAEKIADSIAANILKP
ncbi:MAG: hypothetical protein ABIV48_04135, partial [Pyrinomonadaceae bacterium]